MHRINSHRRSTNLNLNIIYFSTKINEKIIKSLENNEMIASFESLNYYEEEHKFRKYYLYRTLY